MSEHPLTETMSATRAELLSQLADRICGKFEGAAIMFVGVDGVDGSGKTVFADQLARVLSQRKPTVRISIDGFHNRRADRYRLGRDSPDGFWSDSYDYGAFERHVVAPLRSGSNEYLTASHDLVSDELLDGPIETLADPSIVVVDGIFLHRAELRGVWDFSVFLDVNFAVSVGRMAIRDGSDPSPDNPGNRRYVEGQQIYLRTCRPQTHATVVIDNNDLSAPRIVGAIR